MTSLEVFFSVQVNNGSTAEILKKTTHLIQQRQMMKHKKRRQQNQAHLKNADPIWNPS